MIDNSDVPEQLPAEVDRGDSAVWLDMIAAAEKHFGPWQDSADHIDKLYSDLGRWRSAGRDREFAMFWSNMQVMAPSIYARPPVPVVTPKFKDRRPVYRVASEFLERACIVGFDLAGIDDVMTSLRDDLAIVARGVAWVRYEDAGDGMPERVCIDYVDRHDFLHDPTARTWGEVQWVARRAWLTDGEMRERFGGAARDVIKPAVTGEATRKTGVWEVWSKQHDLVVWVTEGSQKTLDEGPPHLKLSGFFPCPRPAYGTLQRRSLVPVPDVVFYRDQLEEINDLTRRIHALSWAVKVRGFYAGGGEIGEAIERAIKLTDDEQLLIPVPALTALMQGGGDPIVWLPVDMIAQTITGLIELRRQIIDDVYQIVGLSDIMRGATEASETLGAQRLKQQNGSVRLRDKQNELIRVARDLVGIMAEVMAEEFDADTLVDMAQMDIPTRKAIKKQVAEVETQAQQAFQSQLQAMVAQSAQQGATNPDAIRAQATQLQEQIDGAAQAQIAKITAAPALEDVIGFLADEKLRPFVLDIETDSTIYPDEAAEKASRSEFLTAFTGAVGAIMPLLQAGEAGAVMAGGMIKFALAPFRVGRELEGMIDDFVDQAPQMARAAQEAASGGDNAAMAQASAKLADAEMEKARAAVMAAEARSSQAAAEHERKVMELMQKAEDDGRKFKAEIATLMQKVEESAAKVRNLDANTEKTLASIGRDDHAAAREDVKTAADIQARQQNDARAARDSDRNFAAGRDDAMRGDGK